MEEVKLEVVEEIEVEEEEEGRFHSAKEKTLHPKKATNLVKMAKMEKLLVVEEAEEAFQYCPAKTEKEIENVQLAVERIFCSVKKEWQLHRLFVNLRLCCYYPLQRHQ